MIRPLRRRHRTMVYVLAVLLPAALATGLVARRPLPIARSSAVEIEGPTAGIGRVIWSRDDLFPGQRIFTSLRRLSGESVTVDFLFRDVVRPDVLVYWSAAEEAIADRLPENARLLGAFLNRVQLPIPVEIANQSGRLVLYSLADHEIVAVSNPVPSLAPHPTNPG